MKIEKLKSLNFDIGKGTLEINGRECAESVSRMKLEFEGAVGTLEIEEHRVYSTKSEDTTA